MRAAVIGLGRMGAFTSDAVTNYAPPCWFPLSHAQAIMDHPDLELAALCDIDGNSIKKASQKYSISNLFSDGKELIKKVKPDLLGIATRTIGRSELISFAVAEGVKAIHVEKPLCNDLDQLNQLSRLFEKDDFYVTWGAIRRFFGVYKNAISLAESGLYGRLQEVTINFGRAQLYWTHPHSVDLILFAASGRTVSHVQAKLSNVDNHEVKTCIQNDPHVIHAVIYFQDGLIGTITQTLGYDFVLSCERAKISVKADGSHIEICETSVGSYPSSQTKSHDELVYPSGTLAPICALVDCLKGGGAAIKNNKLMKNDILLAQRILFMMVQSHLENGRPIALSDIDDSLRIMGLTNGNPA